MLENVVILYYVISEMRTSIVDSDLSTRTGDNNGRKNKVLLLMILWYCLITAYQTVIFFAALRLNVYKILSHDVTCIRML